MMTERQLALVEEFHRLPNAFDDTLGLEKEAVLFRPFSDSWSIIEQIVHCADFDIANFHRELIDRNIKLFSQTLLQTCRFA